MLRRLLQRYLGEPHPRPGVDPVDPEIIPVPAGTAIGTPSGDPSDEIPIDSWPYHRDQHSALAPMLLNPAAWIELPQASAGRRLLNPSLSFPQQSPTPEPDRRIIPRPMPTAYDAEQTVPIGGGNG